MGATNFKFDLVIVGGGLVGTSIGYFCAKQKMKVLLLEKSSLGGGGATQNSRGIVRIYDPDPFLMRWNVAGMKIWREWSQLNLVGPTPYTECGLVYIMASGDEEKARTTFSNYKLLDYPVIFTNTKNIKEYFPLLDVHSSFQSKTVIIEPYAGYCDPRLATRLLGEGIRQHGGIILEGIKVSAINETNTGVEIKTRDGSIYSNLTVLACGAWSKELYPSLDITTRTIPLSCYQENKLSIKHCLIDENTGAYLRPEPPLHFYCGGAKQVDLLAPDSIPEFDASLHSQNDKNLYFLFPDELSKMSLIGGLMGLDAYTENKHPIAQFCSHKQRLYVATGFSGRGAKYAPAISKEIAGTLVERFTSL